MTQKEFVIDNGPSKLDLMLSLFDTDMGARTVKFHTPEWVHTHDAHAFSVKIDSVRRRVLAANIWDIEGIVDTPKDYKGESVRVSLYYNSDTREGQMRFEDELLTQGVMETPSGSKRARALMSVIHKMIAMYQNSHRGDLSEDILKLFEKAKAVSFADDRKALAEAIKNI